MPKREKTPPPADDEPKYLTVVHPYPPHANMELLGDQKEFAFWIASCIGKDAFLAFFHKPASPDMVIIEVMREFDRWEALLGEHRWSEVFKNPRPENRDMVSQVFYCTYNTGRQVQKYGWKRVFVKEEWFAAWSPFNRHVNFPYPPTHWCAVPPEDATNAPLCRHLPVKIHAPPPVPRPPPVGSKGWQDARSSTTPNAWKKGAPSAKADTPTPPGLPPVSRTASAASGSARPNAWGAPPGMPAFSPVYAAPPGLAPWGSAGFSSAASSVRGPATTAWTVTSASSGTPTPTGSPVPSDGGSIGATPAPSEHPGAEGRESGAEGPVVGLALDEDFLDAATDDWDVGQYAYEDAAFEPQEEEPVEDLWADYGQPTAPEPQPEGTIICSAHGKICKKGICKEYARQLREIERKKADEERAAAFAQRKASKKQKGKNTFSAAPPSPAQKGKKLEFKPRQKPPHLGENGSAETSTASAGAAPAKSNNTSNASDDASTETTSNDGDDDDDADEGTSPTSPATPATPASAGPPRSRPAHLGGGAPTTARPARGRRMNTNSAASAAPTPTVPRAAVERPKPPPDDAKSVASSTGGWGRPPAGPWGTSAPPSVRDDDAKSVASSTGGWGNVSNGPWGSASVNGDAAPQAKAPANGKGKGRAGAKAGGQTGAKANGKTGTKINGNVAGNTGGKQPAAPKTDAVKSWADQMEEDDNDDGRSVAESSTGGWGNVSNGPWG